jgi:4'-phosphopantetheinyl transferase
VENEFGRPELESSTSLRPRFNLSKTSGMVACCVARNHEVGLDIEDLYRQVDVTPLAARFFAPAEKRDLLALPEHARRQRFFEYWTLKEAYVKALGAGLSIPLNQFWFQVNPAPVRLSVQSPSSGDPADWQFEHIRPTEQHLIAVAIRRRGPDLPLVVRRWAP